MNLENITTPADLAKANEEKTSLQKAMEALTECGYDDTKVVILWLVNNMADFHKERATDSECETPLSWAKDYGQLVVALEALKNTL